MQSHDPQAQHPPHNPQQPPTSDAATAAGAATAAAAAPGDAGAPGPEQTQADAEQRLAERTADLQRLQAEYVNYKRRVDRDRDVARKAGGERILADLLPVLDNIESARRQEDMSGGFKLVASEIEKLAAKHGLEAFGAKGEAFDPQVHEALMQAPAADVDVPSVAEVLQIGYRIGDRVVRPARVAVAQPADDRPIPDRPAENPASQQEDQPAQEL